MLKRRKTLVKTQAALPVFVHFMTKTRQKQGLVRSHSLRVWTLKTRPLSRRNCISAAAMKPRYGCNHHAGRRVLIRIIASFIPSGVTAVLGETRSQVEERATRKRSEGPPSCYHPRRRENTEMGNLSVVVQQLRRERERTQKEVQRIDAALAALGSLSSSGSSRHTMSAAARKRISLAQKARWAKQKTPTKRTLSAAGRRRIIAAQRKRWAKVKRNKTA
jgi:hypothetical protein